MKEPWLEYIDIKGLPEDYQLIAEAIGLENTIKFAKALSGISIYLVRPEKLFKPFKIKYILQCYANASPGMPFNYRRMALDTGLSIREVYDVIAEGKDKPVRNGA